MIKEVNEIIFKGDDLELSILNPFYGYAYGDVVLSWTRSFYYGIRPSYKNILNKSICIKDKSKDILSTALLTFFPSPEAIESTSSFSHYSLAQEYFSNNESRSHSIKIFSTLFIKLLKRDKLFELKSDFVDGKKLITDPELLEILDKDIEKDRDALAYTLLALHAFMLDVLDTKDELKEYVTRIINLLSEEDKKTIKTSPKYFLKFKKVESGLNEKTIFSILNNVSYCKYPFYFYIHPVFGIQIPTYDRLCDEYDKDLKFYDYVDIALLHLCNLLFYNEEKEQFDLEHLNLDEDSNLLKFYTKYKKPFFIYYDIRIEWSKVIQCWNDIVISSKKYNKNLGKIFYKNETTRNKLQSSIFNIVTILTKICSSRHNDIEKKYIELFDRKFTADSISDLVKKFLNHIVDKSVDLECIAESIRVVDNVIYGKLNIATIKDKEKLKTQISYNFDKNCTNEVTFISKDYLFIDELKKMQLKIKDDKKYNPLEYVIAIFVDELKEKLVDKYYITRKLRIFYETLTISN